MSDFSQFYASGGVFMHAISVVAVAATTVLFLHARARSLGDDDPKRLRLADRLLVVCVGLGLLGSLFGMIDMAAALTSVEAEQFSLGLARGMRLVPVTLCWALMVSIPIWIASTIQRHRSPAVIERTRPHNES